MKGTKAEGFDSISNEMIKNSPKEILDLLHNFLNLCLDKSLIPKSWCKDILSPILKDGDRNDPNNYRGICISSALLKILCTLLNNRIQEHCLKFNIIYRISLGLASLLKPANRTILGTGTFYTIVFTISFLITL